MNKVETIKAVANRIEGCTRADVETVLSVYSDVVFETLKGDKGEKIVLPGIGTFVAKHVPERSGVSAIDGKHWMKAEHDELQFKITKSVKTL